MSKANTGSLGFPSASRLVEPGDIYLQKTREKSRHHSQQVGNLLHIITCT